MNLSYSMDYDKLRPTGEIFRLARISHQDGGPRLFFESTRNFLQSEMCTVIPLLQKILCESKALRDHPAPW